MMGNKWEQAAIGSKHRLFFIYGDLRAAESVARATNANPFVIGRIGMALDWIEKIAKEYEPLFGENFVEKYQQYAVDFEESMKVAKAAAEEELVRKAEGA